jgi:glycogen phosphorylase
LNATTRLKSLTASLMQSLAGSTAPATATPDIHGRFQRALSQRSDLQTARASQYAAAVTARDLLAERWAHTSASDANDSRRRIHYLSMEFLMGRALSNATAALSAQDAFTRALPAGRTWTEVTQQEPDAALGNGGLGRLAACFLDSFATLGLKSFGYGLRYRHGMFAQRIQDGQQTEVPDEWLDAGNPFEVFRPELQFAVGFGGVVQSMGTARRWAPAERLVAQAYDFIVPGHGTERVATLRMWHAKAERPLDFATFCRGDHAGSSRHLQTADALNWLLYPDDSTAAGRELRLKQEFLLVSASLQDMIARHIREGRAMDQFGRDNAVHLNDTHPALAPIELMRLLLDEHGFAWEEAWTITQQAVSYTNHTLMPEALETWPIALVQALLPRHLEVIFEINRRFRSSTKKANDVSAWPMLQSSHRTTSMACRRCIHG